MSKSKYKKSLSLFHHQKSKTMKQLFILLTLCCSFQSFACINLYRTLINGKIVEQGELDAYVHHHEHHSGQYSKENLELAKATYWELYDSTKSYKDLSDYAAVLTYLGEYKTAKNIYHNIEKEHPNLYTTASNLGTIYELIGKPDSAYYWIKKSIELNEDSHEGSEWIHLKILAFKLSKNQDYSTSILDFDFGNRRKPAMENDSLWELKHHLEHQLTERTIFVKPTNKIVGNLYFDYGNLLALTTNLESAIEAYEIAQEYGYENPIMTKRLKYFKRKVKSAAFYNSTDSTILHLFYFLRFFIIGFIVLIAGVYVYRQSKNT